MGPRNFPHNEISSGRAAIDDQAGRAAAGRPANLLPAGVAFDPPANSTPAGNLHHFQCSPDWPCDDRCERCDPADGPTTYIVAALHECRCDVTPTPHTGYCRCVCGNQWGER
jgi:hypothetical protein